MPEVIVRYKNRKALDALIGISRYLDLSVIFPEKKKAAVADSPKVDTTEDVNGVTLVLPAEEADWEGMRKIFTGKDLDAAKIRHEAWKRGSE